MDVYGKKPDAPLGEYFRRSVWGWHPLWELCAEIAPDLCGKVKYAHSNDGDGLNAEDSMQLALLLDQACNNGRAAQLAQGRREEVCTLPDEECYLCGGTGKRRPVGQGPGPGNEPCNACNSTGRRRPFETSYDADAEDVREFAEFLKHCGGFEIC